MDLYGTWPWKAFFNRLNENDQMFHYEPGSVEMRSDTLKRE